ncbi:hypothetical protein Cgig2_004884 [Carnegiea gigantea]|uniref:Uncharacterized protein n=1 Tax=Carnegiea gigantea TaxID=171969 RepID=A0A9Q1JRI2_9CARY|nr:hypothetical protein Cgig2_004884 [Carnegiea gigantea]
MDIMFSNTFATTEHSWDSYALEVNENGGRKGEREDEIVARRKKYLVLRKEKRIKSKVGTAIVMQSRLDHIVEATESFVPHFTMPSVSNDLPRCSIVECMSLLKTLPSVELGSELYMLGAHLFIKRQYREMFIALEDDGDDEIDINKIKNAATEEDKMDFDNSEDENEGIEISDDDDDYE